jgi:hypothetical protein
MVSPAVMVEHGYRLLETAPVALDNPLLRKNASLRRTLELDRAKLDRAKLDRASADALEPSEALALAPLDHTGDVPELILDGLNVAIAERETLGPLHLVPGIRFRCLS